MKSASRKLSAETQQVPGRAPTKRDAGSLIALGASHFHSSGTSLQDPNYSETVSAMKNEIVPRYSWEVTKKSQGFKIRDSKKRHEIIQTILSKQGIQYSRDFLDRLSSTLEELLTNALYHAYRNPDRTEKYSRRSAVELSKEESVDLKIEMSKEGAALEVTDCGGNLRFEDIAKSFKRCYEGSLEQIESKEGGAGLGIYIVFESVQHLKITVTPGQRTSISCWIGTHGSSDEFSFNFFVKGAP